MTHYKSIKQLVIDETISKGQLPSLEELTKLVKEHFPSSKWQKSHYDWYKSQIRQGKIETDILPNESSKLANELPNENLYEFAISLEKDLQSYLSGRLHEIEPGLKLIGTEYGTAAGFIDILAKDAQSNMVIIELKAGKVKDAALGQLLGYIGAYLDNQREKPVRGILIGSDFEDRVRFAAKALPNIQLVKYNIHFKFDTLN